MSSTWILTGIIFLASIVFVMLFGESTTFRRTPIGSLNRFLNTTLPNFSLKAIKYCLGERLYGWIGSVFGYIAHDKHPLVQFFYLFLVTGGLYVFLLDVAPEIPNPYVPKYHWWIILFVIVTTYGSFFIASKSNPGMITHTNIKHYSSLYDYDHILFEKRFCKTCLLDKPARSKHCSVCKTCIAKMDHHCVWINNCVGYNNHRWFLLFLWFTGLYCTYGSYASWQILRHIYVKLDLANSLRYKDEKTGALVPASTFMSFGYLMRLKPFAGALALFAGLASLIVWLFFFYQLYLIKNGTTTNETFKWEDLDAAIKAKQITEISSLVLKHNQNYKIGNNIESTEIVEEAKTKQRKGKKKVNRLEEEEEIMVPLDNIQQLKNIYNNSFFNNLYEIAFPINIQSLKTNKE
ncbi:DHHC palmitoyltransferase-domain-containing protein [Globomyces pollinis-pini]|nr:DHHC palmitoyltransferase-domain-containing protein [Globomyces pollinis-pini]